MIELEKEYIETFTNDYLFDSNDNECIEQNIETIIKDAKMIFWDILKDSNKKDGREIDEIYLSMLDQTIEYLERSRYTLCKGKQANHKTNKVVNLDYKRSTIRDQVHTINQPTMKVGYGMKRIFAGYPIVQLGEIKHQWCNFTEVSTTKTFFVLCCSICSLLFGSLNALTWALLVLTFIHFISRLLANRHRNTSTYITFSGNIQLFLWPYLLLVAGNALSNLISINGFPEGTFIALFITLLIAGELKGIVENAKIANYKVPKLLERIVNIKDNEDYNSPL